jgi:hypothetical protein
VSPLEQTDEGGEHREVTAERLASVVQARLWAMMQRKLYNSAAAKVAFNPRPSEKTTAEVKEVGEDYDLLDEMGDNSESLGGKSMIDDLEDFMKDEFGDAEEFEDLLGVDDTVDDDLLAYFEASERERLDVEHKTDEMLFGSSCDDDWEEDDMDMLLLELGSDNESMLL